jgi:GNAT superfamily N-acetyltransferase
VPYVREIAASQLDRVADIDVSEDGVAIYVQRGTVLERIAAPHSRSGSTSEDWAPEVLLWQGFIRDGGTAFGAFAGDRFVGFAVLRVKLTEDTAQLAALYVDRQWRRKGVAAQLVNEVSRAARKTGAASLYVSATRSDSAVSFYLNAGFEPLDVPNARLFDLEPFDIHMSMDL